MGFGKIGIELFQNSYMLQYYRYYHDDSDEIFSDAWMDNNTWFVFVFLILLAALYLAGPFFISGKISKRRILNIKKKQLASEDRQKYRPVLIMVKVIGKRNAEQLSKKEFGYPRIIFATEQGTRLSFAVSEQHTPGLFNHVQIGEWVKLTYAGNAIIDAQRLRQ